MPELPEVEHARRRLSAWLGGRTIDRAEVLDGYVVEGESSAWIAELVGRRVESVLRHGKLMLARLDGGKAVSIHLGMTGHLLRRTPEDELPRFTRWWLEAGTTRVCFVDGRKLGRSVAGDEAYVREKSGWNALGPDAQTVAEGAALRALAGRSNMPVKALLMDQARLAGIGNIHAAEALFVARIHPETPAGEVPDGAWDRIARGMHETIERALASLGNADEVVYVSEGGENPFFVYRREGEPCMRCGTTIEREETRGRSTYLCPSCQASKKGAASKKASKKERASAKEKASKKR